MHNTHQKGHYGPRAMLESIYKEQNYWWPSLSNDIAKLAAEWQTCQEWNAGQHGYHPLRSPNVALPGDYWQIDLINMNIPSTNGRHFVLLHHPGIKDEGSSRSSLTPSPTDVRMGSAKNTPL